MSTETDLERTDFWMALCDLRLLALGLISFGWVTGMVGLQIWLPQIVQAMGFSNLETGFIVALIFAAAVPAMIAWGRHSDAKGERTWHVALPGLLAAFGFAVAGFAQHAWLALAAFTCVSLGIFTYYGPFFSLPSSFLKGSAAAGGIGLINCIATTGGFVGPLAIGVVKEATGGYAAALSMLAAVLALAAVAVLALASSLVSRKSMLQTQAGGA